MAAPAPSAGCTRIGDAGLRGVMRRQPPDIRIREAIDRELHVAAVAGALGEGA